MLMTIETCPGCGDEIDLQDAPGGLCPVCLMRRGVELANTDALALQSTPSAGPQFAPPDPLELEADLPDFDILELVGQGGMGAVYKARHRGLDRVVAIKILPRRVGADQQLAERFAREARALARLKHEQIVMAFDAGLAERYSYFVMEYIDGPNLRQLLVGGALPPARSLEIARDVCEALRYAHENGVVHRDIKPENVLIAPSGRAKLADFGLAKLRDPSDGDYLLTATQQLMGTLHYMAPEQTESPHTADHRADVYALGVLLYEMLTGELPLGVFDPPSSKCPVDRRVDEIVLRALAKDPERRYATAAQLLESLATVAERNEEPSASDAEPHRQPGGRRRFPRRLLVAAGFAGAILIAFFGWQFLLKYHKDKDGAVDMTISANGDDNQAAEKKLPPPTKSSRTDAGSSFNPLGVQGSGSIPPGNSLGPRRGGGSNGPPPSQNNAGQPAQGTTWSSQVQNPLDWNGTWAGQPVATTNSYTLSPGPMASSNKPVEKPATSANDNQSRPAEKPANETTATPSNNPFGRPRRGTDDFPPKRPAEKPSKATGSGKTSEEPNVSLIEIAGPVDRDAEGLTEDLPILLSHPVQKGSYPDKSLTLDYQLQVDRLAKDGHYYLVIDGDHIGRNEMPIPAIVAKQGKVRLARMPEAGNGEPLRISIEVAKPDLGRRVRASNIIKTTVKIAGTPSGEIRYPNHLAIPAAAVHWNDNRLDVDIKGEWYELLEINGMDLKRIMEVAQKVDPKDPHKLFEDRLAVLLEKAGQTPDDTVTLKLRSLATREEQELDGLEFRRNREDKDIRR